MPKALVIIVNYRVGPLTVDCLASLAPEMAALPGSRTVVVENASGDESEKVIGDAVSSRGWSGWATMIRASENRGFAAGNNLGLQRGLEWFGGDPPEYIFFLNPDTVLRDRAIQILVEFMEANPEVGIAGGRSEDPDATPQHCCFRFPSALNEFASNIKFGLVDRLLRRWIARVPIAAEAHPIDWVSGAAMLIRRGVIERVGVFDENYFLYYEETDLTLRARRAGWTCFHVPRARIVHYVGTSSGVTVRDRPLDRKPKYWFDSRRRFFVKNHGWGYAALADLSAISGAVLGRIHRFLQRKPNLNPPKFIRDLIRNSVFLRRVVPLAKGDHGG